MCAPVNEAPGALTPVKSVLYASAPENTALLRSALGKLAPLMSASTKSGPCRWVDAPAKVAADRLPLAASVAPRNDAPGAFTFFRLAPLRLARARFVPCMLAPSRVVPDRFSGQPTKAIPFRLMPLRSTPASLELSVPSTANWAFDRSTLPTSDTPRRKPTHGPSGTVLPGNSGVL